MKERRALGLLLAGALQGCGGEQAAPRAQWRVVVTTDAPLPQFGDRLLVEVLPRFTAAPLPVSLLYPHRRQLAPRVQAMLQWIAQVVAPQLD